MFELGEPQPSILFAHQLVKIQFVAKQINYVSIQFINQIFKKIDFKYQAYIYNNTGNDWKNQKLTLAIINPNDDLELPVLKAWVIGNDNRISDNEGRLNSTKG